MNILVTKIKSYINTKYNHFITPFYERYFSKKNISGCCLNTSQRTEHVVVSLTSYPARFSTLHLCIKSILNQSIKPDKINLYLDNFVLDTEIPDSVKELEKNGLSIRKIPHNLRSHKKYFFAMQECPDSLIITFDDDVMYRKNTIRNLLYSYKKYPYAVSALRVHKITVSRDSCTNPYQLWKKEYKKETKPSFSLCAVGVGGVLYPPHILPVETFSISDIKENCYKADDLWLKFMETRNNIPVVWKRTLHVHPVEIAAQRDTGLNLENVNKNQNDEYVLKMERFTGIHIGTFRQKKITFITAHNWNTKRQGCFHKFAEASVLHGYETVFFSFPRPFYGLFMKREQLNAGIIRMLTFGKTYMLFPGRKIINITFPTFRLPDSAGRFFPERFMNYALTHSFYSFKRFSHKYLADSSCFIFESCEGIIFADLLRKLYPNAKIIYRPSDPMVYESVPERVKKLEQHMLYTADKVLIVNNEGLDLYRSCIPNFDTKVKYNILSNGIDIESYTKQYPSPVLLSDKKTVLYVGAWSVEWELLFNAAVATPDLSYVVVCPNYPSTATQKKLKTYNNILYVPGIKPQEVPAWITNCSIVMVPYQTDFYKDRPLGITAKYYQAMAAHKPIVAYSDTPKLRDVGIPVTYTYDDFISEIKKAVKTPLCSYSFNLYERTWSKITDAFLRETELTE